jgi:PAS domain S-box-containing protein
VVLIATAQDDVLGHVRERERVYYAACALATVLILLVTFAALRAIARHERHVATLASAKAALRRSEAQARAITEGMAAGIVATDEQFRIVSVNPAFTQCFGWSLEEVRGRTVECLAAPIEHARLVAMTQELHHRTQDFRESGQEFLAQRKNGEHFEVEVMMSRFDVEGERTYLGIVYDISERKQMERLMRANEEHFRATFDQALIGIVHASLAGRFVRVNQHMCDMLGYSELELLQRTSADVTHPDDRAASDGRFEALRADHRMHFESQVTKRFVRKDGTTLWALVAVNLIRAADGTPQYFLGMVQDITEIKRVDQMKSEFISTVSHELRTPLTSIRGSLGLLTGGMAGALPAAAKELVGIAENNCERLIRLVSDILDTERLEAGKMRFEPREMDVRPLVERAVESNDGFARMHGVRLRAVIPAAGVYGLVDPDCFAQVMTNLISNAVKFSPPDGEVTVALSRPSGETMRVEVIDQGPGIPIEFQPRIFRRFSQADSSATRDKGGTGLGLSIAKGIVEKHQGHIGFETAAGRGTTFHFEIPALAPAAVVLAD